MDTYMLESGMKTRRTTCEMVRRQAFGAQNRNLHA